jgi:hypothetical protein
MSGRKKYDSPQAVTVVGLKQVYSQWKSANEKYLSTRLAYDTNRVVFRKMTEGLRAAFVAAKARVKIATEAYYAYLQKDSALTLTQLEESKLFTEAQIQEMKATARSLIKEDTSRS